MPVESISFFDDVCDENAEDMLDCNTENDQKVI
jgi:hypothetical protein